MNKKGRRTAASKNAGLKMRYKWVGDVIYRAIENCFEAERKKLGVKVFAASSGPKKRGKGVPSGRRSNSK